VSLDRALSLKRSEHDLHKENQMLQKKLVDAELRLENQQTSFEIKQMSSTAAIQDYQRKLRTLEAKAKKVGLRAATVAQSKYPVMKDIEKQLEELKSKVETPADTNTNDGQKYKEIKTNSVTEIKILQKNLTLKNSELVKLRHRLDNYEFNSIGNVQEFEDRLAAKDACIHWQQLRHNFEKTTGEELVRTKNQEIWRMKEDQNDSSLKNQDLIERSDQLLQKIHDLEQSIRDNEQTNSKHVDLNDNVYKNGNLYL